MIYLKLRGRVTMNLYRKIIDIQIKLMLLTSCILLLALLAFSHVSASEPIRVLSETVINQFPDGILFSLSVESDLEIQEIDIVYSTAYGSGYNHMDFQRGKNVNASFFLRTKSGGEHQSFFTPPGAVIIYHFEIFDGKILYKTNEKHFVYLDQQFQWESISKEQVTVYFYGPVLKRADVVLTASLLAIERMSPVLGLKEIKPINIVMYNHYRHMIKALPFSSQSSREGLITEGEAFTKMRVLLVLGSDSETEGIASHEITHILVEDAAGNSYPLIPSWLNEGLAEYGNIIPSETYTNALEYGYMTRRLQPLFALNAFSGTPNDIVIAYGKSRNVIYYLINIYGKDKMAAMFFKLNQGFSLDQAMVETYGFNTNGLEQRWIDRVNANAFLYLFSLNKPTYW